MTRLLDFVIVGAQKAGTTSLHRYLERHPRIYLPAEKEAFFFSHDDRYAAGWDWFVREFYRTAGPDKLWGKATPQYMADPTVPDRMAETAPNVRLIALLRNPIERAYSHYRMTWRRGLEKQSFDEVIRRLTGDAAASRARGLRVGPLAEAECCLAWGEYGRILAAYLERFPRPQLLIQFTEVLKEDPQRVLDAVTMHLGLGLGFTPPNLGRQYHRGGSRDRVPWLRGLVRHAPFSALWRSLPARYQRYLTFWGNVVNVAPAGDDLAPIRRETRLLLTDFFRADVERLRALTGLTPPWPEFMTGGANRGRRSEPFGSGAVP
ncbi:MAG: sulfotransferase family protein [Gemmatimonadales bacterium]